VYLHEYIPVEGGAGTKNPTKKCNVKNKAKKKKRDLPEWLPTRANVVSATYL
jgi:hypothetical protein